MMAPSDGNPAMGRKAWIWAILLTLLPAGLIVGFMIWGKQPVEPVRGEFWVMERWDDGTQRTLLREWQNDAGTVTEICQFDAAGVALGCGLQKNNLPQRGVFVDWYRDADGKPTTVRLIREYADERPHGTWTSFDEKGRQTGQVHFENGRRISPAQAPLTKPAADKPTDDPGHETSF